MFMRDCDEAISGAEAIREALGLSLADDDKVYLMGLGVPDPKGVFGTTLGLQEQYGCNRVMDMPVAENGVTGAAIGAALVGMRPVITHQRFDFALLSFDQLINNASKWHNMFGGQYKVPLVIRVIVGRGWGQGPQHSQNFQSLLMNIPGLKVVAPSTPYDAKGLLIASIKDDNPVIFIEHRWIHNVTEKVPTGVYSEVIGKAKILREGNDITIVTSSYMTLEALRVADHLRNHNVSAEVVDLRSLKPLDEETILSSVKKTGRLLVVDGAWKTCGISAEIISLVAENLYSELKTAPKRLTFPEVPTPTTWSLARYFYPSALDMANTICQMVGMKLSGLEDAFKPIKITEDIPDKHFTGPF